MKLPRNFYQPLAIGAPEPWREPPVRLERMIHFVPPHVEKLRAKVPELVGQVDVLLGNLEDAIPADAKEAARRGFIAMAKAVAFGATGLWTRINALNSPWALDDVTEIVAAVGNKLDVIMLPKVEGAWNIHYLDQLLAQLEPKHRVGKPILIHAILEPAQGAIAKRVFSPDPAEVAFAKRILDAMPDGSGAVMIEGKMQDDATWKQAKVVVDLARLVAAKDPELATRYGL